MADEKLVYTIEFDRKTGALISAGQDVEKFEKALAKANKQLGGTGADVSKAEKNMKQLGEQIGKLPQQVLVFQMLSEAVKAAVNSSEGLTDLKDAATEAISSIVQTFAPAIDFISKGLQGVLIIIQRTAQALMALASGEFKKAGNLMADSIMEAADRIEGGTAQMTAKLREELAAQAQAEMKHGEAVKALRLQRIQDAMTQEGKTSEEKIALLQEAQAVELEALIKSEEKKEEVIKAKLGGKIGSEKQFEAEIKRAKQEGEDARLALAQTYALKTEALEREALKSRFKLNQEALKAGEAHVQAELDLRKAAIEEQLSEMEAGDSEKVALLRKGLDVELASIEASYQTQRAIVQEQYAAKELSAREHAQKMEEIAIAEADAVTKAKEAEAQAERRVQKEQEANLKAFSQATISAMGQAATTRYQQTKNAQEAAKALAGEGIRQATQEAQKQIAIQGSIAAAKAFANAGGFPLGVPAMVATLAVYAGLAAAVGVAGNAIASQVDPGSASQAGSTGSGGSGNGGQASQAGQGGAFSGGGGGSASLVSGVARNGSQSVVIQVSGADLLNTEAAARRVGEEVQRQRVQGGV